MGNHDDHNEYEEQQPVLVGSPSALILNYKLILAASICAAIFGFGQVLLSFDNLVTLSVNFSVNYEFYGFWLFFLFSIATIRVPFSLFFLVILLAGVYYTKKESKFHVIVVLGFLMLYFSFYLIYLFQAVLYLIADLSINGYVFVSSIISIIVDVFCVISIAALIWLYISFLTKHPRPVSFSLLDGITVLSRFKDPDQLKKGITIVSGATGVMTIFLILECVLVVIYLIVGIIGNWNSSLPILYYISFIGFICLRLFFFIGALLVLFVGVNAVKSNLQKNMMIVMSFLVLFFAACVVSATTMMWSFSLRFTEGDYLDAIFDFAAITGFAFTAALVAILFVEYGLLLKLFNTNPSMV